jgi:hypothetical protein
MMVRKDAAYTVVIGDGKPDPQPLGKFQRILHPCRRVRVVGVKVHICGQQPETPQLVRYRAFKNDIVVEGGVMVHGVLSGG